MRKRFLLAGGLLILLPKLVFAVGEEGNEKQPLSPRRVSRSQSLGAGTEKGDFAPHLALLTQQSESSLNLRALFRTKSFVDEERDDLDMMKGFRLGMEIQREKQKIRTGVHTSPIKNRLDLQSQGSDHPSPDDE